MKVLNNTRLKLGLLCVLVFIAGCRPTIEFSSDSVNATPGETVNLEWEVELAKGTTSAKVTISGIGEVETEGSQEVTVDETKDFNLRVSTFVLGMPITAKETVTVNVIEDGLEKWDFVNSLEDWSVGYVFHDPDYTEATCPDSSTLGFVSRPGLTDGAIKICLDNESNKEKDGKKRIMGYASRKVSDSDIFEIEEDEKYDISYEIQMMVAFTGIDCGEIEELVQDENLLSQYSLIVGASKEPIKTREQDGFIELDLESFFISNSDGESAFDNIVNDPDVDGADFEEAIINKETSPHLALMELTGSAIFPETLPEQLKSSCDKDEWKKATISLSETQVSQFSNNDRELILFVGLLAKAEQPDVEIYFDQIKASILPSETGI